MGFAPALCVNKHYQEHGGYIQGALSLAFPVDDQGQYTDQVKD